jgi:hypothetical protein
MIKVDFENRMRLVAGTRILVIIHLMQEFSMRPLYKEEDIPNYWYYKFYPGRNMKYSELGPKRRKKPSESHLTNRTQVLLD